jgi:hypothetical protein
MAVKKLNAHGSSLVQMLVPRSYWRTRASADNDQLDTLARSHANRIVASADEAQEIWRGIETGIVDETTRRAHLLPHLSLSNAGDLISFLERRESLLKNLELDFAQNLGIIAQSHEAI